MKKFLEQLKWQFIVLQKNNIVSISLAVTFVYGAVLYFLGQIVNTDKLLVGLILNDPSVIGYFFIVLSIASEIKHRLLPAIFVSPLSTHHYLISRILSIALLGWVCSLALALFAKGVHFDILNFSVGSFGVCLISALLGLVVFPYATEFLRFSMISIPVFLVFINLPLLDYLGGVDLGVFKYLFPVEGGLALISGAFSGELYLFDRLYGYASLLLLVPVFYTIAHNLFIRKIIQQ